MQPLNLCAAARTKDAREGKTVLTETSCAATFWQLSRQATDYTLAFAQSYCIGAWRCKQVNRSTLC